MQIVTDLLQMITDSLSAIISIFSSVLICVSYEKFSSIYFPAEMAAVAPSPTAMAICF